MSFNDWMTAVATCAAIVAAIYAIIAYHWPKGASAADPPVGSVRPPRRFLIPIIAAAVAWAAVATDFVDRHWISSPGQTFLPKLQAEMEEIIVGASQENGKFVPAIVLFLTLENSGAIQTTAKNFRLSVTMDGNTYSGTPSAVPKNFTIFIPATETEPVRAMAYRETDALYNKLVNPIQPGGAVYGFLIYAFPTLSDYKTLVNRDMTLKLSFSDIFSHQYEQTFGKTILPHMQPYTFPGIDMTVTPVDKIPSGFPPEFQPKPKK
jgi:hypothetical protein